jgi:hypothetical protein
MKTLAPRSIRAWVSERAFRQDWLIDSPRIHSDSLIEKWVWDMRFCRMGCIQSPGGKVFLRKNFGLGNVPFHLFHRQLRLRLPTISIAWYNAKCCLEQRFFTQQFLVGGASYTSPIFGGIR